MTKKFVTGCERVTTPSFTLAEYESHKAKPEVTVAELAYEINELQREAKLAEEAYKELFDNYHTHGAEAQAKIEELEARLKGAQLEREAAMDFNKYYHARAQKWKAEVKVAGDLTTKVERLMAKIGELTDEKAQVESEVDAMDGEVQARDERIAALVAQLDYHFRRGTI